MQKYHTSPEFESRDAWNRDLPIRQVNVIVRELVIEPCSQTFNIIQTGAEHPQQLYAFD